MYTSLEYPPSRMAFLAVCLPIARDIIFILEHIVYPKNHNKPDSDVL
jgi:hypothetical protein